MRIAVALLFVVACVACDSKARKLPVISPATVTIFNQSSYDVSIRGTWFDKNGNYAQEDLVYLFAGESETLTLKSGSWIFVAFDGGSLDATWSENLLPGETYTYPLVDIMFIPSLP